MWKSTNYRLRDHSEKRIRKKKKRIIRKKKRQRKDPYDGYKDSSVQSSLNFNYPGLGNSSPVDKYKRSYELQKEEHNDLKMKYDSLVVKYNIACTFRKKYLDLQRECELYKSNFVDLTRKVKEKDRKLAAFRIELEKKSKDLLITKKKSIAFEREKKYNPSPYDFTKPIPKQKTKYDPYDFKTSSYDNELPRRAAKTVTSIPVRERYSPTEPSLTLNESDRGILLQFDDSGGVYGKYHKNLEYSLFHSPGKLSRFDQHIDRVESPVKYYKILFFVCVSSGGRKVNLMMKKKFERLARRAKEVVIIDCRSKKRYEASGGVGDEDFSTSVDIVYVMMPGANFSRGDASLNEQATNNLYMKLNKIYPEMAKKKKRFSSSGGIYSPSSYGNYNYSSSGGGGGGTSYTYAKKMKKKTARTPVVRKVNRRAVTVTSAARKKMKKKRRSDYYFDY